MSAKKTLDDLRSEIDVIDTAIHDLLIKRTEVVEGVREFKKDEAVKIRPAREAEILYRLVARHRGVFPKRELARIWREIIVATLGFEGPFSAAYFDSDDCGYGDLTRDQYGSFTPTTAHTSVRRVIEAVRAQQATVGVLPLPRRDDQDPWWRHLVTERDDAPRIIARLPFTHGANARGKNLEALVICPVVQEPTGRDRSFIALEAADEIGMAALARALESARLPSLFTALWHFNKEADPWLYLAEVDGFVAAGDQRLARFSEALDESSGAGLKRVIPLGGYGVPLTEDELGPPRKGGRS